MTRSDPWPDSVLRLAMWLYAALWWVFLPFGLLYLRHRARRDPLYFQHLGERFGRHAAPIKGAVWVHAVSLGEMRSATPLVRALLAQGDTVVTTHFTPAGLREAKREFADDIAAGRVQSVWVPLEFRFAYNRFLRAFQPRLGLVMEIEVWPMMIARARALGVPLYMCNGQYPHKSFEKDLRGLGLRARLFAGFAGGFIKSRLMADRLRLVGMRDIAITGELRFDQPVPQWQLDAATQARPLLAKTREVITLTSVVEGEDAIYIETIKSAPEPLYIYVPRAPERFDEVAQMMTDAGLRVARRSDVLDPQLKLTRLSDIDVLLGDSMGEMYFYLALCDRAVVGGGFVPKGAHNIIEPLALRKPVLVGPHIWTITYPANEAISAGVCKKLDTREQLLRAITQTSTVTTMQIEAFFAEHAGGVVRTLAAINDRHPRP